MSSGNPTNSARRTYTFASADLNDVDGVKTSAATIASETTYLPAVMDGAGINTSGVLLKTARTVTATLSGSVGSYSTDPIVITGKYGGETVTDELTPSDADGGETLFGDQPFDILTSIVIPAQVDTSGAISFGVGDICARKGDAFCGVRCDTAITVHVQYDEGDSSDTDAHELGQYDYDAIAPNRVLTGTGETSSADVTVYLP